VLSLDVTDLQQIAEAVTSCGNRVRPHRRARQQRGLRLPRGGQEGDDSDVQRLFATNFFGPVALIKAVLPGMRARHSGVIANISSIAAQATPPGSGYYSATKAALEGMTGSLRREM
jgi:NADP-dependent 3-hydroxy acid dehydrogenase YdfG